MARKTIDVEQIKTWVNGMLAHEATTREERIGAANLLELTLMDTGNYKGFQYLASEYLPASEQTTENVLRPDYDDTRRKYF